MTIHPPRKLITSVARRTGISEPDVRTVLEIAFHDIKMAAATGTVTVRGFGTFHTTVRRGGYSRKSPSFPEMTIYVPTTRRLALRTIAEPLDDVATPSNVSRETEESK